MTHPDRGLTCPKCRGPMTAYERNGITIDQCTECRGIFLDRGELERLIDAESSYYDRQRQPARATRDYEPELRTEGHQGRGHDSREGDYRRRKRGGLLSELFD